MGLCGVEGGFRGGMEVALRLLRDHKDVLLSVLEPFITVSKGRRRGATSKLGQFCDAVYAAKQVLKFPLIIHSSRSLCAFYARYRTPLYLGTGTLPTARQGEEAR